MAYRFNAPLTWPQPPAGWVPPQDWKPDPSWPPPPPGWQFWQDDAPGAPGTAPPAQVGSPPPLNYETPEQARLRKSQEKSRRRAQRHLEPGEQLQSAFIAQTGPRPDDSLASLVATVAGVESLRTGGLRPTGSWQ